MTGRCCDVTEYSLIYNVYTIIMCSSSTTVAGVCRGHSWSRVCISIVIIVNDCRVRNKSVTAAVDNSCSSACYLTRLIGVGTCDKCQPCRLLEHQHQGRSHVLESALADTGDDIGPNAIPYNTTAYNAWKMSQPWAYLVPFPICEAITWAL